MEYPIEEKEEASNNEVKMESLEGNKGTQLTIKVKNRTWKRILTRSRGATTVLAKPPAMPPARSSLAKRGMESNTASTTMAFPSSSSPMFPIQREKREEREEKWGLVCLFLLLIVMCCIGWTLKLERGTTELGSSEEQVTNYIKEWNRK